MALLLQEVADELNVRFGGSSQSDGLPAALILGNCVEKLSCSAQAFSD